LVDTAPADSPTPGEDSATADNPILVESFAPDTRFVEVAVSVPLRRTFIYSVPPELAEKVGPGSLVKISFGRRSTTGFVVGARETTDVKGVKPIQAVEPADLSLPPKILRLGEWVADYYLAPLGEVLRAALPSGLGKRSPGDLPQAEFTPGAVPDLTPDQRTATDAIYESLSRPAADTFLLHGVTGSGKTEVYLRAATEAVARGGRALILIPEIALSPQMVGRVESRFGGRVALWHSSLTPAKRREVWTRTRRGEIDVLVGARSAVFAPLPDLRLIVVDEEHETTYKQGESPRYHARDVALVRARMEGAVAVLGSATPSLESYANARRGKYRLLELPRRVGEAKPAVVELAPLPRADDPEPPVSTIFGDTLRRALAETLSRGDQSIVFLNRRGHSTIVRCSRCRAEERCTACDIVLTYHAAGNHLRCHYCGARRPRPVACGACGEAVLLYRGVGTQKVEDELDRLFPTARVLRLDTDSARKRGALEETLETFRRGEADILLGTQMVAKGLDFHTVTLVGVVNADTQLQLPDFRSGERTFQLLTQVAGRSGRGERPGSVIFQTDKPDHPAVAAASRQDYAAFFEAEMKERAELGWPPHRRLVNLMLDGKDEAAVIREADNLAAHLAREIQVARSGVDLLGPAPQPVSRLKGKHRWHVTLRGPSHTELRHLAGKALSIADATRSSVRLAVDVDPLSLL